MPQTRAATVRPGLDPPERLVDLGQELLGALLEPFVELAHVRLGRAVGEVVAGSDGEVPGLLEQRAVVMDRVDCLQEPVALAHESGAEAVEIELDRHDRGLVGGAGTAGRISARGGELEI